MISIVSYEDRGKWGNNKYRGNCSGELIKDLLEYYKPKKFIEVFAGGGTGYEVARELGYTDSLHLDLNPRWGGWNALRDEIPAGADFIFSHPPYHNMVVYSGEQWGTEAHPDDLSRCSSYEEFVHKLNIVNAKIYNALRKGGRHAMLIGDMRKKGKYYSMIKDLCWYGELESHIIKVQHNCMSDSKRYANANFIPIKHEHLLVFRKDELWVVNMNFGKRDQKPFKESKLATWRDLVSTAMEFLGGKASLSELYDVLKDTAKAKANPNWQAKIRQTLQLSDEFSNVSRGVWKLQFSNQIRTA